MPTRRRSDPKAPGRHRMLSVPLMLLSTLIASPVAAEPGAMLHAGWVERARVYPGAWEFTAKLDTGADVSSLDCRDQEFFIRAGARWIRCTLTDDQGHTELLEREVVRMARIKRHGREAQKRPVVLLGLCVGDVYGETEVNLVDRTRFRYRLLIGRKFMKDRIVVDPGLRFTRAPHCRQATP